MGYDLHISRRTQWFDENGPEIAMDEWKAYVASDDELTSDEANGPTDFLWSAHPQEPWPLWWNRGEVYTKNPNKVMIRKLIAIAERLRATVQGDDGEFYGADGASYRVEYPTPASSRPSLLTRIASWFRHRRSVRELQHAASAFRPGQRVKNPWGELGTVSSVDQKANGGLGSVCVRLDNGREQNLACMASGLKIVDDTAAVESGN